MGIIIKVVAVLEIHMDKIALAVMKPKIIKAGREPKAATTFSAIRACRPQRSMASATIKPPSKSMTIGLA